MTANHLWLGQFTLATTENDFTIDKGNGANAIVLTAGDYYLTGYTGENASTYQLLDHFEERCWNAGYTNTHCSYDADAQRVTVNFAFYGSESNVDIGWTDSALQTILGFTGTQANAQGYVAQQAPKYIWSPSKPAVDYPGHNEKLLSPRSTSKVGRSVDGTSYSVAGNIIYDSRIRYQYLGVNEVLEPASGTVGGDLENFFEDVFHRGVPCRVVFDRTSYENTACYITGVMGREGDEEIGSFEDFRERDMEPYNGLWSVELPLIKHVT